MGKLKIVIAAAAAGLLPLSANADLSLSGQVSPVLLFGGDVENPEIADNTGTGSRIRLRGNHKLGGITVFTRYEIQIQENQSFGALDGSESIDTRYAEVGFKGKFGSFSLGKGDGAANGTGEVSYQVTGNILGGGHLPFFAVRGVLNRDNAANVAYTYYDGFSRNSRIRYDTPSLGGLKLSASLTNGERSELAARFKRGIGPGKLTAVAGFANTETGAGDRTMLGIGYKFKFGLSGYYSFTSQQAAIEANETEQFQVGLGYAIGKLNLSVDFGEHGIDGENEFMGFGAEYKATKQVDIYGGVQNFDNGDGASLSATYAGFRYKY